MKTTIAQLALLLAALPQAHATTVRVHYDAGPTGSIAIRADKGAPGPNQGVAAVRGPDQVWSASWRDALGDITLRPALNDKQLAVGASYRVAAGATLDIYPFFGPAEGKLRIVPGFISPQLNNQRALRIYLPPSYDENRAKRYPVLYMHDGQNLFDAKTAAYGVEWGIAKTIDRLVAEGQMDEVIVVGIDNTPERIPEYTPCCDPKYGGGKLDAYTSFIIDSVKPWVDANLRTLPGAASSAIMGSSLGGIASVYIAQRHPQVFSMAGGVSSSFWWADKDMIRHVPAHVPVRFYLDAGTKGDGLEDSLAMRDAMLARGYRNGADLMFYQAEGASHNEASWAARVDQPLRWFFPFGATHQ